MAFPTTQELAKLHAELSKTIRQCGQLEVKLSQLEAKKKELLNKIYNGQAFK